MSDLSRPSGEGGGQGEGVGDTPITPLASL